MVLLFTLLRLCLLGRQSTNDWGRQLEIFGRLARQLLGKVAGVPPLQELEREYAHGQGHAETAQYPRAERSGVEHAQPGGGRQAGFRLVQLLESLVVGAIHSSYAGADQPHERAVVLGPVKQVGEVEGQDGKAVAGVDAGIYVANEPLVVVEDALLDGRIGGHARVVCAEQGPGRLNLVRLVELALEVGDADNDGKVLPHVGAPQLERLPHDARGGGRGPGDLGGEGLFALQAVKVFGKGAAAGAQIVALDDEHDESVELIEGVERSQEVARVPLRQDGEQVAQCGRQQRVQLLLGQDLEEGRLLVVKGAPEGRDELHGGGWRIDRRSIVVAAAQKWRGTRQTVSRKRHCAW